MKTLLLANQQSPHLEFWKNATSTSLSVAIYGILSYLQKSNSKSSRHIGTLLNFSGFSYLSLGLKIRYSRKTREYGITHLQNASGYGLSALVCGQPCMLTTYGSEVHRIENSGVLYRWLIDKVLDRAEAVTCSSIYMKRFLHKHCKSTIDETSRISQPASENVEIDRNYYNDVKKHCNKLVLIVNRRVEPQYRTLQMLAAFVNCSHLKEKSTIIVLEGATTSDYYDEVKSKYES